MKIPDDVDGPGSEGSVVTGAVVAGVAEAAVTGAAEAVVTGAAEAVVIGAAVVSEANDEEGKFEAVREDVSPEAAVLPLSSEGTLFLAKTGTAEMAPTAAELEPVFVELVPELAVASSVAVVPELAPAFAELEPAVSLLSR